jgi:hypothetical protein
VEPNKGPPNNDLPRADMDQIKPVSGDAIPAISAVIAVEYRHILLGRPQQVINDPMSNCRAKNGLSLLKNSLKTALVWSKNALFFPIFDLFLSRVSAS